MAMHETRDSSDNPYNTIRSETFSYASTYCSVRGVNIDNSGFILSEEVKQRKEQHVYDTLDESLPKKRVWSSRALIAAITLVLLVVLAAIIAPTVYFTVLKEDTPETDKQVGKPPVNGSWNDWQPWSDCSATCGNGVMTRNRSCDNPPPSPGGNMCDGSASENQNCKLANCPVNGNWSVWLPWSSCSTTCDNGTRTRNRTCDNPVPAFGGDECDGFDTESKVCMIIHCPINGSWSPWQPWSDCPTTCGGGLHNRTRTCDNPAPEHNGQDCDGHDFETSTCGEVTCPPSCGLGTWTEWNDCSASCGEGVSRRTRICDNNNGCECIGILSESKSCQLLKCYDSWGEWSACSVTCGSGIRTRNRTCDGKFSEQECGWHHPTFKDRKKCENPACPVSFCANRNASCQYTHPNRCDLYIECDEIKAMHEHMCNVLLWYKVDTNDECIGVCDWEANVPCSV